MLPLKGKKFSGPNQTVGKGKFKIYSENLVVDEVAPEYVDCNSKMSVPVKKGSLKANSSILKANEFVNNDGPDNKGKQKGLGNTKPGRQPLVDLSNLGGNFSRAEKPPVTRNSIVFGAASTASSRRPPAKKVQIKTATFVTASHMAVTRNSLPVLKKEKQLDSSVLQGGFRSEKRKTVFNVRNRSGGLCNPRGAVLKDREINGFIRLPPSRIQTGKEALQGIRKSVKPHSRNTQQISGAQRNNKSKSSSTLGMSLGASSARRVKVATSAIRKTSKSMVLDKKDGVLQAVPRDNPKPEIFDTRTRSGRRKSFTSSLISRSKSIGQKDIRQNDKADEQEKLPDIDDEANPLEVALYVDDIYEYYWVMEAQSTSLENYIIVQTEITSQMRGILVNWLIEVHFKFDLMPETLYLAVGLLDRYISLVPVKKRDLQLVGVTSLLLASKYEDFWHPRVKELISISAEPYTREQILEMEKDILKKLKFRLNFPTAYVFMLRFLKASQSGKRLEHLAFYLIELSLVNDETLRFRPSMLCASAVYLARSCLKKVPAWTPLLEKHSRYDVLQLRECAKVLLKIHRAASSGLLNVTYEKYKQPEFGGITTVKPLDSLPK